MFENILKIIESDLLLSQKKFAEEKEELSRIEKFLAEVENTSYLPNALRVDASPLGHESSQRWQSLAHQYNSLMELHEQIMRRFDLEIKRLTDEIRIVETTLVMLTKSAENFKKLLEKNGMDQRDLCHKMKEKVGKGDQDSLLRLAKDSAALRAELTYFEQRFIEEFNKYQERQAVLDKTFSEKAAEEKHFKTELDSVKLSEKVFLDTLAQEAKVIKTSAESTEKQRAALVESKKLIGELENLIAQFNSQVDNFYCEQPLLAQKILAGWLDAFAINSLCEQYDQKLQGMLDNILQCFGKLTVKLKTGYESNRERLCFSLDTIAGITQSATDRGNLLRSTLQGLNGNQQSGKIIWENCGQYLASVKGCITSDDFWTVLELIGKNDLLVGESAKQNQAFIAAKVLIQRMNETELCNIEYALDDIAKQNAVFRLSFFGERKEEQHSHLSINYAKGIFNDFRNAIVTKRRQIFFDKYNSASDDKIVAVEDLPAINSVRRHLGIRGISSTMLQSGDVTVGELRKAGFFASGETHSILPAFRGW